MRRGQDRLQAGCLGRCPDDPVMICLGDRAEIERALMPLDASYDQLMRLLSARGLEWLRQRVMDLPDPLPPDHPDMAALALAAQVAPVLSGLRGHPSPLEDIVARRLATPLVLTAAGRFLDSRSADDAGLVLAGRLIAPDQPLWRLAMSALADDPQATPADRLAAGAGRDPSAMAEAEALLTSQDPTIQPDALDDGPAVAAKQAEAINRMAWLLMQLYGFGASRPKFSHPRVYGTVFTRLLDCADWARRHGSITAMAQCAYCLRLIDPDHDIAPLIAEIIANQRPDGSFPAQAGNSSRDQDLATGAMPTLMALAALNLAAWGRWRGPRPDTARDRPFGACRDLFTAAMLPRFEGWASKASPALRLDLAAALSRATGENWFLRFGLNGTAPSRAQLSRLARRLFGDAYAARHARRTLRLDRHWPHDLEQTADSGPALRWLRGAPVALHQHGPFALLDQPLGKDTPEAGHVTGFDQHCQQALAHHPALASPGWRAAARHHARQALAVIEDGRSLTASEALAHLDRLCVIAQLTEGGASVAAAA